jgi:hypothetical protein
MAQQFHEHKMDVLKMDLLTRNKRKKSMLMGIFSIFSDGSSCLGIFAYALDDETRIMKW